MSRRQPRAPKPHVSLRRGEWELFDPGDVSFRYQSIAGLRAAVYWRRQATQQQRQYFPWPWRTR